MSEWWTYTLADFLMFSPRAYWRLFERYNVAIWPVPLIGLAFGVVLLALMQTNHVHRGRIIAGMLAAGWLWIAWAFHSERYAEINWAATWFAAAFAGQALLFVVLGVIAGRIRFDDVTLRARGVTSLVVTMCVVGYPLLAPLAGRPWSAAEIFGIAPDPTAIATVAVLALVRGWLRWLLLAVPVAWCAIAAATLWAMESTQAIVVMVATLVALWPAARAASGGVSAAPR